MRLRCFMCGRFVPVRRYRTRNHPNSTGFSVYCPGPRHIGASGDGGVMMITVRMDQ